MIDLTAEELASVAREVIGDAADEHPWNPENEAWQWQMLVEWLADAIEMGERLKRAYYWGLIRRYVRAKDITSLQRMALELRTKS